MSQELVAALGIAVAAGLLRGFAGVGSGMFMAPFFVHLFGPVQTVGIIILIEIVATAQLLPSVRQDIDWGMIWPMGLAAAALMPVGGWLLVNLDRASVQFGVALLVSFSALLLMSGWRYEGVRPKLLTVAVGGFSGFLMAVTSLGNPPVMVYLLSSDAPAKVNRANFTGYFALTLVALIALMALRGLISRDVLSTAVTLLPGFLLATWLGSRMFRSSNELTYRRVALGILLIAGIYGMYLSV